MSWEVEYTDEFGAWWQSLTVQEQDAIATGVEELRKDGPQLSRPLVDTVKGSRHSQMKELRTQIAGSPYRTFFAFDPRRSAILLIGGCKQGDKRFYDRMIPIADDLFDTHLAELKREEKE